MNIRKQGLSTDVINYHSLNFYSFPNFFTSFKCPVDMDRIASTAVRAALTDGSVNSFGYNLRFTFIDIYASD